MASTFTPNLNYEKPGDGDPDWGTAWNANADALDTDIGTEHKDGGAHGPKVTIDQTNDDSALTVSQTTAATTAVITVVNSGTGDAVTIDQVGASNALMLTQDGAGAAFDVTKNHTGSNNLMVLRNFGTGRGISLANDGEGEAVFVDQNATGSLNAVRVDNAGTGDGVQINQAVAGVALHINHSANANSIHIEATPSGSSIAVVNIDNSTGGAAISIDDSHASKSQASIGIIRTSSNGSCISCVGSGGTVFTVETEGRVEVNGLKLDNAAVRTIDANGEIDTMSAGAGSTFNSYLKLQPNAGVSDFLDSIDSSIGFNDGMILVLKVEDAADTITVRHDNLGGGSGDPIFLSGGANRVLDDPADKLTLIYDFEGDGGSTGAWCELSFSSNT